MATTTNQVTLYAVGGSVRDELLGLPTKDYDFTAVVSGTDDLDEAWSTLRAYLGTNGFEIFVETPQYMTMRAKFPRGHTYAGMTADFVLAREEGPYSDGRHPDWTRPGSLESDLGRRDFSINAMAKDGFGEIIDLFGGREDLDNRLIKCVGSPEERFSEDALRALRAIRFAVTKEMTLDASVFDALRSEWLPPLLASVSVERRREELLRAFKHDTLETLTRLRAFPDLEAAVFSDGLWLMPSLRS